MNASTLPRRFSTALAVVIGFAALAVVVALGVSRTPDASRSTAAQPPSQLEVVHAERWSTAQPFQHEWRADRPWVASGWLLVLSGDPAKMVVRQTKEPVLYVGAQTAERINSGQGSGKLVVIVPGDFWLEDAPVFYGGEALPEELRQPAIDRELAAARAAGAVTISAERAAAVTAEAREFANDYQLRLRAIDLVERFSPTEKDLIAGWRVPLVK